MVSIYFKTSLSGTESLKIASHNLGLKRALWMIFVFQPVNVPAVQERLNGVNRQPSNGQTFSRQPSKRAIFTVNRQTKQLLLAVKRLQGLSNLTILVGHLRLLALTESLIFTDTTSFDVLKYA